MDITAILKKGFQVDVPFKDGSVTLRFVSRGDREAMAQKATTVKMDEDGNKIDEKFNLIEFDVLLGRASVCGWSGMRVDGQEFPYSPENCDLLMREWRPFADFVRGAASNVEKLKRQEDDETVKN